MTPEQDKLADDVFNACIALDFMIVEMEIDGTLTPDYRETLEKARSTLDKLFADWQFNLGRLRDLSDRLKTEDIT